MKYHVSQYHALNSGFAVRYECTKIPAISLLCTMYLNIVGAHCDLQVQEERDAKEPR